MHNTTTRNRIPTILYPILIYLVVYEGVDWLFTVALSVLLPGHEFSSLVPLMAAAAITSIPLFLYYKRLPESRAEAWFDKNTPPMRL